jgi:hypothetical protein
MKALLVTAMVLISSAAVADSFDFGNVRLIYDSNGSNRDSVSVTTPELFGNTFDLGGSVDTSGKNDIDLSGTFDRTRSNGGDNGAVLTESGNVVGVGTTGSTGGAQSVPESGTLILLSTGMLGLIVARKKVLK